jgi:iron complex transport system substrate-binding protein
MWRQYKTMKAVRNDNLFTLESSLLNRAGPRMIIGTTALCEKLELARKHRKNGS